MGEHVRRAITSSGPFKAQWIQPYLKKIFPSHRPGYQEDAHELLTLILDALDPTPPAAAKQHNGPATNAPNQFRLCILFFWFIFPSHRPGYQEDAHELLTLILDALDPTPPAAAKQHNGPATNAPNQFRLCILFFLPKNTLRGLDGVFHLVKHDEKTKAYLVLWTVVRIILQMGEISCFNEALLLPSSLHSHRAVCDIRPCICLREPSASTPMEQLFGGALRNEIRCFGCGENYVNYERIRELNLGLRMRKREGIVGINDLLVDYFSNETLSSFECKKCKRKTQAQRVTRVIRAPHVLVVQLKRFNACGSKIRLPMNVKLDRFMYLADDRNAYSLCGLIEHQGEGIDRGHYIAFVRGFDGKGWHCFDDETVWLICVMLSK
uniref:Ubiquitin carboxyl-terminal hydrolase 36 n=1 Tax=Ascaris lumbricoides TaxID=6252 RepID=A0A0M3I0Z7_ASCLU